MQKQTQLCGTQRALRDTLVHPPPLTDHEVEVITQLIILIHKDHPRAHRSQPNWRSILTKSQEERAL